MQVKKLMKTISVIMIALNSHLVYSDESKTPSESKVLEECDKTLNSCDLTVHLKNEQIKKQEELLEAQSKELATVKTKSDNPLTNPIVWASVGTAAVGIAGPLAIPFVVLGAVLVGVFLK